MAFSQGVSGLNAAASNLDVIGNNIANSSTVGFKSGSVQFADVYAGSKIGLGTRVSGVVQNFSGGAMQASSRPLDVAITNGDGFFRVKGPGGEVGFTRNGQFNMDKDGYIVNAAGMQLTGYQASSNGLVVPGTPSALQLPPSAMAPNPTSGVKAQFNLDSRSAQIPATPAFDANKSATYNYANSVTVFDSLGSSHELSTFFAKTAANTWSVYATADGYPLTATGSMAAPPTAAGPPAVANSAALTSGALTFSSSGAFLGTTPISFAGLDFANGSKPLNFSADLNGTTQFGSSYDVKKLSQDGFTAGQLASFAVGQDGTISGKYSNEQSKTLGQIVLASFANPNGLQNKGDNIYVEASASGQPATTSPGVGTKVGSLTSGVVEASNVDLTAELVNLIIAQRAYQANAQTIKTQDQVSQTLINLR